METVYVRFEMPAAEYRELQHRAIDERKTMSQLLRDLVKAGAALPKVDG